MVWCGAVEVLGMVRDGSDDVSAGVLMVLWDDGGGDGGRWWFLSYFTTQCMIAVPQPHYSHAVAQVIFNDLRRLYPGFIDAPESLRSSGDSPRASNHWRPGAGG